MKIFSNTAFEITKENVLKLYGENATCTDVILSDLKFIKRQNFIGLDRIILIFENKKLNYYAIENSERFLKDLESQTGIKYEKVQYRPILFSIKVIIIYFPSIITYLFMNIYGSKITIDILYVILNLNTIFFFQHISEDKMEGGISGRTARRIIIILTMLFFFQLYKVFG